MFKHPGQQLDRYQERNAGQPAITRPTGRRWPLRRSRRGSPSSRRPARPTAARPERRSASSTSEATISMPSTDSGNACACHPSSVRGGQFLHVL
jgi:hypothetical protein